MGSEVPDPNHLLSRHTCLLLLVRVACPAESLWGWGSYVLTCHPTQQLYAMTSNEPSTYLSEPFQQTCEVT